MGETAVAYIMTDENKADILTKALPNGEKRWKFVGALLWDLEDGKNGRTVLVTPGTGTLVLPRLLSLGKCIPLQWILHHQQGHTS